MKPEIDEPSTNEGSNSLPQLAARIRAFHQATAEGLRRSVENGMAAGDLLIEAKAQLKHGQWLPWLRDNCNIAERTVQLYMRLAKNRAAIEEKAKSADFADLNINEVAALLMLSSDTRKLLEMMKTMAGLSLDTSRLGMYLWGPADWMKPNPARDAWMPIPQATFDQWHVFLEANRGRSLDDVKAELNALQVEDSQRPRTANRKKRRA